jgi:hypothetical protein
MPLFDHRFLIKIFSNGSVLDPLGYLDLKHESPVVGIEHCLERVEDLMHLIVREPIIRWELYLSDPRPSSSIRRGAERSSSLWETQSWMLRSRSE